jgi:MerR family copper efflux transcriptional regulator
LGGCMKIGEIAQQTGVSRSIIRYYEGKGVLPPVVRDASGYRDYGDAELRRIRLVTGARRLGCSFPEIKALIALQERHHIASSKLLELVAHKISEVDDEMERLRGIRAELLRLHNLGASLVAGQAVPVG